MKNFILQIIQKRAKLLVFLIFLISLVLLITLLSNRPKESPTTSAPPTSASISIEYGDLPMPQIFPKSGKLNWGETKNAITLKFDKTINKSSVQISSQPPKNFKISTLPDDLGRIIITPLTPWETGKTYKITIFKGIKTALQEPLMLKEDINLEYEILSPTRPNYDRPA